MAWQMPFTSENDDVYPASYWRVISIENLNFETKTCAFRVVGYKDQAHRQENKPQIGERRYLLVGDSFDKYVSGTDSNIRALVYDATKDIKDVLVSAEVPAIIDDQGNITTPAQPATFKSFFEGATAI